MISGVMTEIGVTKKSKLILKKDYYNA